MRYLLIGLLMAIVFGCSEDDPQKIKIETESITLFSGEKEQIQIESQYEVSYASSNAFHADVNNTGLVEGVKVGEAEVILECEGEAYRIPVIVEGNYDLYIEPLRDWSLSKSDVINKYGKPDSEDDDKIGYLNYSTCKLLLYAFDQDDKIETVGCFIDGNYASLLGKFLKERYHYLGEVDDILVFIDSFNEGSAKNIIMVGVSYGSFLVMYSANNDLKSSINFSRLLKHFKASSQPIIK
ncbi:MAG: hypothetical protein N4A71_21865 [Carboxylicivirga sp.]|jgi:hypothetical protein|nr:hypothetical protein [Carboxylicivirga sp.]